jgi:hypothetical protein
LDSLHEKKRIKTGGRIKRLSREEAVSPPSIDTAIDFCALPSGFNAIGSNAITVVSVVIRIGRNLTVAPP